MLDVRSWMDAGQEDWSWAAAYPIIVDSREETNGRLAVRVRCDTVLFRVLGGLAVEDDAGQPVVVSARMRRLLLGRLLVAPNRAVPSDQIAESLWGESLPQGPEVAIRLHVSRLRNDLGGDDQVIVTRSPGYLVRVGPDGFDAQVFERLVDEGDRALAEEAFGVAAEKYQTGLGLWRGSAYEEFVYESWAQPEIRRLEELRWHAVEQRIETDLHLGREAQLVPELEGLTAKEPLREKLWGQLMLALYRSGRQGDALRAYTRIREILVEELGVDPSTELQSLEQKILGQDPELYEVAAPERVAAVVGKALLATQLAPSASGFEMRSGVVIDALKDTNGEVFLVRDGLIVTAFADAVEAVTATRLVLEVTAKLGGPEPRMAVDIADVERIEHGFRGLGINRTVRIAGLAESGQLLLSSKAAEGVRHSPPWEEFELVDVGYHEIPGVTKPVELYALAGRTHAHVSVRDQPSPTNIPAQITSFVGRAFELEKLTGMVSEHRLVTVTGPGGAGKTRLALQAASDLVGDYKDGVWLIELGAVTNPDLLATIFGQVTGLVPQPGPDPRQALLDAVADRELLLVVDNCEHLIDATADLLHALLTSGPDIGVLATSREPLGIPGERQWLTPLLSVPDPDRMPTLESLDRNDAVGLFVTRGETAQPGFELTDANARTVVEICGYVDLGGLVRNVRPMKL